MGGWGRVKLESMGISRPGADLEPYELIRPTRGYALSATVPTPCRAAGPAQGDRPAFRFSESALLEQQPCRRAPKSEAEVKEIAEKRLQPENAWAVYTADQRRGRTAGARRWRPEASGRVAAAGGCRGFAGHRPPPRLGQAGSLGALGAAGRPGVRPAAADHSFCV